MNSSNMGDTSKFCRVQRVKYLRAGQLRDINDVMLALLMNSRDLVELDSRMSGDSFVYGKITSKIEETLESYGVKVEATDAFLDPIILFPDPSKRLEVLNDFLSNGIRKFIENDIGMPINEYAKIISRQKTIDSFYNQ